MDFKIKFLTVGGKKLKLTIWDTGKKFTNTDLDLVIFMKQQSSSFFLLLFVLKFRYMITMILLLRFLTVNLLCFCSGTREVQDINKLIL